MKTIVIANHKGGVGKTTTALALADGLKREGKRVLFVDTDPQVNSTGSYHAVMEDEYTLYDLLKKECSAKEAVQHTDIGDIIPGDKSLAGIEAEFQSKVSNFNLLRNELSSLKKDYDYVVIDTAPTFGFYTTMSLLAADGVIIPIKAEKYAMDGLSEMITVIKDAMGMNTKLKLYGVVITAYDQRNALDRASAEQLPVLGKKKNFRVFDPIRTSQDVKNAQSMEKSIFDYSPACNAAVDYRKFVEDVLKIK